MSTVSVPATRWELGWELWMNDDHVTQSRTLADAAQQVRDYLDTEHGEIDHSDWTINVVAVDQPSWAGRPGRSNRCPCPGA